MNEIYLFEIYEYGYDDNTAIYVEYIGNSLLNARMNLFLDLPKAYILNEYKQVKP
jgi:hypothetical protein